MFFFWTWVWRGDTSACGHGGLKRYRNQTSRDAEMEQKKQLTRDMLDEEKKWPWVGKGVHQTVKWEHLLRPLRNRFGNKRKKTLQQMIIGKEKFKADFSRSKRLRTLRWEQPMTRVRKFIDKDPRYAGWPFEKFKMELQKQQASLH